jgi:hypothetical protein
MKFQIEDIETSLAIDILFGKAQIRKTDKYPNLDLNTFRRDICSFKAVRPYAWDFKSGDKYEPSAELGLYLECFDKIFTGVYQGGRELTINHEQSTGVLKLTIGEKDYFLHLSFPQMYIIYELNKNNIMTATQISIALGNIPLNHLASAFNSLMYIKLIVRDVGAPNDPNVSFMINKNWSCPNSSRNS